MPESAMDQLARHRIREVKTRRLRTRWPRLLGRNARLEEHGYGREFLVREIVTDQGVVGWGLSRRLPPQRTPVVEGRLVSELFDPAIGVIDPAAMPLDFALHDLAGAILCQPVYRMLGGQGPTELAVYDASTYMDDITPAYESRGVQAVLDHCRQDWDLGHRGFKVKIGRGCRWMEARAGLRRDIEVTRAVREAFPDCLLMVDANDGYDCRGFLEYFRQVADCRLFTLEEPFRENREDLCRLREEIARLAPQTTVTDGEARPDIEMLLALGREGLIEILNVDIESLGLTGWRALAPRALECGLRLSPHTFDLKVKTHYAAHLVAGVGGAAPVEGVIDETEGVEFDAYRLVDGALAVPDRAGFGMRLIWGRCYNRDGLDDSGYPMA